MSVKRVKQLIVLNSSTRLTNTSQKKFLSVSNYWVLQLMVAPTGFITDIFYYSSVTSC